MKNMYLAKFAITMCTSLVLYGCVGNPERSVPTVSEQDAFVAQKTQKQLAKARATNVKENLFQLDEAIASAKWIQPQNKSEDCRLWFAFESLPSNADIFWDGDCNNGYAYGLGRAFLKFIEPDRIVDREAITYYEGGQKKPEILTDFNHVKNVFTIYAYGTKLFSSIETSLHEKEGKSYLFTQVNSNEKLADTGFSYQMGKTSLINDWTRFAQVADGNNATSISYWGELYNYGAIIEVRDGAYAIAKMADGTVRHIDMRTRKPVHLPKIYLENIAETEKMIKEEINDLYSMIDKSKNMINYYLSEICSENVTVSFISNERYKEPCAENGYFTQYMPAILMSQEEETKNKKAKYENWLTQQEQARQLAYQRQMVAAARRQAEAAEQQADAADQANFQNNLNAIIDRSNAMINGLNNSTPIQMYQPPRATAPTYYNRVGNSIVGGGTTCTGIGNSIVCR